LTFKILFYSSGVISSDLDMTARQFLEKFNMLTEQHRQAITVKASDTVVSVIFKMKHSKHYRVFVVNNANTPIGVISLKEVMNYLAKIDLARDQKLAAEKRKVCSLLVL
jgi:CBS domain-containing protein